MEPEPAPALKHEPEPSPALMKQLLQLKLKNAYLQAELCYAQERINDLEKKLKDAGVNKENMDPTQRWIRSCGVYQLMDSTGTLPYFTYEINEYGDAVGPIVGDPNSCQQQT